MGVVWEFVYKLYVYNVCKKAYLAILLYMYKHNLHIVWRLLTYKKLSWVVCTNN